MAWLLSRRNCQSFLTANTVAGPLGRAHRSGRARGGNHQDPPATLLRHGRTAHPHRTPPHPASAPTLALGKPVHSRPHPIARHSPASLTAPSVPDAPTGQPLGCPAHSRQPSPRVPLPACRRAVFAGPRHSGLPPCHWRGHRPLPSTPSIGTGPGPFAFPYPSSHVSTPAPYPCGGFGLREAYNSARD